MVMPFATQVDPKAFDPDGSVRHAILTIELPKLRSGQDLNAVIVKQGDAVPGAPPAAAAIPALDVIVGIKGADGTVKSIDVNLQSVAQNPRNAVAGFWINGPLAQERRYMADVNDHLQILFDVFAPKNGPARIDVIFHNDWTGIHRDDNLDYDVEMRLAGAVAYQARGVHQYTFSTWHHLLWTDGQSAPRIGAGSGSVGSGRRGAALCGEFRHRRRFYRRNRPGGEPVGRQTHAGRHRRQPYARYRRQDGHRSHAGMGRHRPYRRKRSEPESSIGERRCRGLHPMASARTQDRAAAYPSTRIRRPGWIPAATERCRKASCRKTFNEENHGWTIDDAHQPALNYLPYLLTGSQYYRDELAPRRPLCFCPTIPTSGAEPRPDHRRAWRGLAAGPRPVLVAAHPRQCRLHPAGQ